MNVAAPTILVLLVIGGTIYAFGYARAVNHRSNVDYKKTKAGLPGMRKDYWATLWTVIKAGFWIAVVAFILITWAVLEHRK